VPLRNILTLNRRQVGVEPGQTYQTVGIQNRGRGMFLRSPIQGSETKYTSFYRLQAGDLAYSRLFGWEGSVAVVPKEYDGFFVSPEFPTFNLDYEQAQPEYIQHICRWTDFHEALAKCAGGLGQRRQRIQPEKFLSLEIPLPASIGDQQAIAARLDRLYEARAYSVENTGRAKAVVQALHNAVCQVDAPLVRVGSVVKLTRTPVAIEADQVYAQIGVYSFGKGLIRREPQPGATLSKLKYYRIPSKALVLSNIQAWEKAIALSDESDTTRIASQRFLPYLPVDEKEVDTNYLRYYFLSEAGHPLILKSSPGTTVRNRTLGIKAFENLMIPLPDMGRQRHIASLLDRAYEALRRMEQRIEEFDALYQAALSQAFGAASV
jgi:type I restriction enzyme S subunit